MTLPNITMKGNLTADPECRFTPSGAMVVKFRVACTARVLDRQTNVWRDGDSCFLDVEVWREQAENIAESLERGVRVVVDGSLRMRGYENKDGEKRNVFEVINPEVSVSMVGQTAKVTKVRRGENAAQGNPAGAPAAPATPPAQSAPAAASAPAAPVVPAAPATGGTMLDEAPF